MECPFKDTWAKINDEIDTFPYRKLGMDLVHNGQAELSWNMLRVLAAI